MHESHKIDAQEAKKTKREETKQFIRWSILGAVGGFLYYFVIKALNADIDEKYRKIKYVQFLCGIFTVAIALTIHTWMATMAWFATYLGPRIGAEIRTVPGGHVGFIVQAERYLDLMETFLQRNGI